MNQIRNMKDVNKSSGFTLLEVMVVVVILAIMAAAVGPKLMASLGTAKNGTAASEIKSIETSLKLYKLDNYSYPSTDQGLEALVSKPSGEPEPKNWKAHLERMPKDPWGNAYKYLSPGTHGDYDIYSTGDDGIQSDDDITSWVE